MAYIRQFLCYLHRIRRTPQHFYLLPTPQTITAARDLRQNMNIQDITRGAPSTIYYLIDHIAGLSVIRG